MLLWDDIYHHYYICYLMYNILDKLTEGNIFEKIIKKNKVNMKNSQKILVVDDSETNLVLVEAVLIDAGYEVDTVDSYFKAINALKENIPQLILLDILMPEKTGFDLMKKLKDEETFCKIPIIIVTAHASNDNKLFAKELGAVDVIEKPIDIPDFLNKIDKALN
jgi:CheY-like chemotaxis protein